MASWAKYCANCAISNESIVEMEKICPVCGLTTYYILTPELVRSYKIGSIINSEDMNGPNELVDLAKWYRRHAYNPDGKPSED